MADYLELVQRLRGVNWVCHTYGKDEIRHDTVCHEAADAIEALVGDMPASRAQQKLIEQNAQIVELQNALAECLRIIEDWHIEGFNIEKPAIHQARKVLGEKE